MQNTEIGFISSDTLREIVVSEVKEAAFLYNQSKGTELEKCAEGGLRRAISFARHLGLDIEITYDKKDND